jgi:GcrA cell cycle regulator
MSMRYQSPKPPHCPSCAQIMPLARVTSRFGDLPDLYTFECGTCGVAHIDAGCPIADIEPEKPATRVQTHELEKHHCRWPVKGADAKTFFCGADRVEGSSYCARHSRMAYQPAGATRSRAESEAAFRRMTKMRKASAAAA